MCKDYIDPTGHFLGTLFAWVGKVVIGGVVNAVVDTGVRLLTGQEVSLKTIGSSFVEGCVASAAGSAAAKLVGKAVGAVKNTKTAAKIASATSKVKDKTAGLASKAIEKVKASRAASKVASTKKSVNTPAAKSRNIKIKGYTKHGINQAISHDGKGVKPSSIIHAVKYGTAKIQKNGTIRYTSEQASVVLNAMQKVVSAWAKSSKYWRK